MQVTAKTRVRLVGRARWDFGKGKDILEIGRIKTGGICAQLVCVCVCDVVGH